MKNNKIGNRVSQQKQQQSGAMFLPNGSLDYNKMDTELKSILKPTVVAKTSDYTILASEVLGNNIFTNEGATGDVTFTLPSAVAGYRVTFIVQAAYRLIVATAAGDVIYCNGSGGLTSIFNIDKGSVLQLWCINATEWVGNLIRTWLDSSTRGLFAGGNTGSTISTIQYIVIPTNSNSFSFGNLSAVREGTSALGSLSRAVFGGGYNGSTFVNVIEYVEIGALSDTFDFGDLTVTRGSNAAGCSNSTRGLFGGGYTGADYSNVIDYITIASPSNATDFGDLTAARDWLGSCQSSTRGFYAGGESPTTAAIDYVTIASTGNAGDFGDLSVSRYGTAGCSGATRGLFGGGSSSGDTIDYITMATLGNATDFGNLSAARTYLGACSSLIRGVWAGGTGPLDTIEYVEIATTGNTSDFGNLLVSTAKITGCSNGHGGLA